MPMSHIAPKMASDSALFAPDEETKSGGNADIYFERGRQILAAENLNPIVTMEFFARRSGILCGMREASALLAHIFKDESEVWALNEGSRIEPLEVVLRIRAPYRDFGLYETALLGILSSQTGWASAAAVCVAAAGQVPVVSFGARHIHPRVSAQMEYAAVVGGCQACATPKGAQMAGLTPTGTLPHALILCMGSTVTAARAFDQHIDPEVRRIILVDTFMDEVEESARVAQALGDRLWGVRLDTPSELGGVTVSLVSEVRQRLDQLGFRSTKIVVSGGLNAERIREFVAARAPVDGFGIGSAISSALPIEFTADVKEVDGTPIAKRGRTPGITENLNLQKLQIGEAT